MKILILSLVIALVVAQDDDGPEPYETNKFTITHEYDVEVPAYAISLIVIGMLAFIVMIAYACYLFIMNDKLHHKDLDIAMLRKINKLLKGTDEKSGEVKGYLTEAEFQKLFYLLRKDQRPSEIEDKSLRVPIDKPTTQWEKLAALYDKYFL